MAVNTIAPSPARRTVGVILAISAAFLISISNISLPFLYANGGNVGIFMLGRNLLSLLICLAVAGLIIRGPRLSHGRALAALGSGSVYAVAGLLVLGSIARIPVSLAILILFSFPILTALIQAPLDRRWPSLGQLACLLAALMGIGLALEIGRVDYDPLGISMAAIGAVALACAFVWNGHVLGSDNTMTVMVYMSLAGLAVVTGYMLASGEPILPNNFAELGLAAFGVAVVASSLAFLAMFKGVQLIGATKTAMVMNLEPIFTIGFAFIILSEALTMYRLIGATTVICAVLASQWLASAENLHDTE